jgi:hypothetical protein
MVGGMNWANVDWVDTVAVALVSLLFLPVVATLPFPSVRAKVVAFGMRRGAAQLAIGAGLMCALMIMEVAKHDRDGFTGQATAAWVQGLGTIGAVIGAGWVSSTQIRDQRAREAAAREEFASLVYGVCKLAATNIAGFAVILVDPVEVGLVRKRQIRAPSSAADVIALRELDINRMPAAVAVQVAELRRLAGWTAQFVENASGVVRDRGEIPSALVVEVSDWGVSALNALQYLRNALIARGHNPDAWEA